MPYQPLNERTVIDYVRRRPALGTVIPHDVALSVKEVGDGNLNLVFAIATVGGPPRSAVLKQALPYLRVAGASWTLTRERMRFETQALLRYNELAPGLSPQVYDYDEEMSLVIMENLEECDIMRKPLVARRRFPHVADHISTFLARTLFFTSDLCLPGIQKKALLLKNINPDLCKLQEDFVYSNPFMDSPENKWNPLIEEEIRAVRNNGPLKVAISEMKEQYMTHAQALLHGDLHTGSIMLNEHVTKVIDPEFAFFGPMGYDVGALLENLVLNYLSHFAHTPNAEARAEYQEYLLSMVQGIWNDFARKFDKLWTGNPSGELPPVKFWNFPGGMEAFEEFRCRYIQQVLRDAAGHGGCKMLRRIMGIVSVWDLTSIEDLAKRAVIERLAIRIGSRWILERNRIHAVTDLISMVREETFEVSENV
jgi:5-methylthioribose kinase